MSIQLRLNLAIALVVAAALAAIVTTTIMKAGPRIRAENESIMRLSKEFVETAVESLKGMREPAAGLENLLEGLKDLRHVEISLMGNASAGDRRTGTAAQGRRIPAWLERLVGRPRMVQRVPVDVDGRNYGVLLISATSSDEIREIWDSTFELMIYGALLGLITIGLASLIVRRAVAPVHHLGEALSKLEDGNYQVRVPAGGAPEIAVIGDKLNGLAKALERERSRNRSLTERMVDIQDAERKELAHELHDEIGPHLFMIRAAATALGQETSKPAPDPKRLGQGLATLREQIEVIQRTNRRVLERLRPVTLAEFGLAAALEQLAASWRKERPEFVLESRVADVAGLGERVELTVYRIIQEGLTNAYRHSGAKNIAFEAGPVAIDGGGTSGAGRDRDGGNSGAVIEVRVHDDGAGMQASARSGFGLTGMRDRVAAVGGRLRISERERGGIEIVAVIPARERDESETRTGES